jgi:adenylate cyclase
VSDGPDPDVEDTDDAPPPHGPLHRLLLGLGVPAADVDQAERDGTLALLSLELAVSRDAQHFDLEEAAARSGIDPELLRAFWRALGFPDPRPGEKLMGPRDLEMLGAVVSFINGGAIQADLALQMARVIGAATERMASAQVDAIEIRERQLRPDPDEQLEMVRERARELLPLLPRIMEMVWRRQLGAAARRRRLRASEEEGAERVLVGFADLVGFTAQAQQIDEQELADVVTRFENIAYEVIGRHRGRVVKLIGDEVMFMHERVVEGAVLALDLSEAYRRDDELSDVRVGLACGPVLEREGDIYGHTVNLASRITNVAYPGAVVVSQEVSQELEEVEGLELHSIRQHYLKDIGRAPLWTLRRAGAEAPAVSRRVRDVYARRRDSVLLREARRREVPAVQTRGELLATLRTVLGDDAPPPEGHDGEPAAQELPSAAASDVPSAVDAVTPAEGDAEADPAAAALDFPTTEEIEVLTEVVLEAEVDVDVKVELLADLEAARRVAPLQAEAARRTEEADREVDDRLAAIEREVTRKLNEAQQDYERRVEEALREAEQKAEQVQEAAARKVNRMEAEVERKAEVAARDARRAAERKAAKHKADKDRNRDAKGKDRDGKSKRGR